MKYSIAVFLFALALPAFSQGTLTPPGAPAPTMKTLAQIEPRTPVESLGTAPPYTISQPGSYYLSANMVTASGGNAISIEAENVTLDLNGFTISSPPGGSPVNCISSSVPAVIRNGYIKGSGIATSEAYTPGGFAYGIYMPNEGTVIDLTVQGCSQGIIAATVIRCQVKHAQTGISAQVVMQSTAKNCSHTGISATKLCSESNGEGGMVGILSSGNVSESTGTSTRVIWGPGERQYGIKCKNAMSSTGIAAGNGYSTGIEATDNVSNSTGTCTSALDHDSIGLIGISCSNASNSQGIGTNFGIRAFGNASNCYGKAGSFLDGVGIRVDGTASFCRGDHRTNSVAMDAGIAIGCTSAQGIILSPSKHLGTP